MEEIWKDIKGYEGLYQVSNSGKIKRNYKAKSAKILTPFIRNGYYSVRLSKDNVVKNYTIHRLIAQAFILNSNNYEFIDHINGIKTDNRLENLEWVTAKENTNRAWKAGLCKKNIGNTGIKSPKVKKIIQMKGNKIINEFYGSYEAQRHTGISSSSINMCCNNKRKTAGGYQWKFA